MAKTKKEPELAPLPEPVATSPVVESVEAADQSANNALGSATDNEAGAAPIAPASTEPPAIKAVEYTTFIAGYPANSDEGHFHAAALERALSFFGVKLKKTTLSNPDGTEQHVSLAVVVTREVPA